jgi:hypothetical protein
MITLNKTLVQKVLMKGLNNFYQMGTHELYFIGHHSLFVYELAEVQGYGMLMEMNVLTLTSTILRLYWGTIIQK